MHLAGRFNYRFSPRNIACVALLLFTGITATTATAAPGDTRIAKWKNNSTAVFLLMFDDSWPSHWQVAAPELIKRNMTATFYVNPGKGEYKQFASEWENKMWKQGMVYGDHTLTHRGAKDLETADWEIGECARFIRKITGLADDAMVSYGQPGVPPGDWTITPEQTANLLKKYNLVDRPPFTGHGAVYELQTTKQMLDLADSAIDKKGMEYLVIHGVERIKENWGYQDFWALKQDVFLPLLDGLAERRDKGELWITDHISAHKYEQERDTSKVITANVTENSIELRLESSLDSKTYDAPLTLITQIPAHWKKVKITQAGDSQVVKNISSKIHFEAVPGSEVIQLEAIE